jgi:hypothetical protein
MDRSAKKKSNKYTPQSKVLVSGLPLAGIVGLDPAWEYGCMGLVFVVC